MALLEYTGHLSVLQAIISVLGAYALYGILLVVYRLYFSPLSKFPGPKLAAASLWYEFYFDVYKRGKFFLEIKRLHEVYGPIVRINPYELHINDPDFYDNVYSGKRDKHSWSADMFVIPGSMISTVPHDLHRKRRAPIATYFSQQAIRQFDPVIRSKLDILCSKYEEYMKRSEPANMEFSYTAFTTDIITEYAFGASFGFLEQPGFNTEYWPLMLSASEHSLLHKQIPWITKLRNLIPLSLLLKMKPEMGNFVVMQNIITKQIQAVVDEKSKPRPDGIHPTIFHGLLNSDLPSSELSMQRLLGEGQTIVAAGSLTTAHYLKSATYHILAAPQVLNKLRAELMAAMPDPTVLPPYKDLDRLPYLNAVINEGFRTSHGVLARLTRVPADDALRFHDYDIPIGTPLSMSSWLSHMNESLFPEPEKFRPERWLEPGADQLKNYLVNFTRGARMCLGKDLARTEIVYTLSTLFRRYDMELFESDETDVIIAHDFFNPRAKMDSKGVRVIFKGKIA
ncbi:putative P450 monooxygenase [Polyplosphaeria fusca]|uniref:P450 monooxygenase n=1 Tax=Polyplosphaeria fusca TaxID=682080 RepID=A0A9P4QUT7_9PLEO|nr:putative P450 monooxygenase [Polyplosphaeria fusca]